MASNPNEIIEPPEQIPVSTQPEPIDGDKVSEKAEAEAAAAAATASRKVEEPLEPSEDLDLTDFKQKPPPRKEVDPTYRGWQEVGGWDESEALTLDDETTDLLTKTSVFDTYLPSSVIGDWYHGVGYLIVGALLSWFVGYFRFSLSPIFFIMISFSILYRSSVRKYRTLLRKQAQREFSIKSIENDYETMDWLNNFLEKFWYFLEPSISQIVCEQVNPVLAKSPAPAFIKQLWIDSFTAGTKPPRIDAVKTLHGTADDVVVMDWGFSFTPNALADSNNKQLKNKVNQKTVVKASLFGITIPVAVSDVSFKSLARVRLRMMPSFPHIETINLTLLEPPQFDFNTKILGDSIFNWEVLAFPGLYPLINEMIKKYVGPMLFTPLSFQVNVQQLMAGHSLDSSIGVLAITAHSARGLKGFSTIGNTLDPYLTYGYRNDELAKTSVKDDTSTPVWNSTSYVTIKTLSEPLDISVYDYNDIRKDRLVGTIQYDLEALHDERKQSNITGTFLRNNKPVGELQFSLNFMPTLEPQREVDGAIIPPPDLNTGIARIEIAEARHLKAGDKPATTYAELYFDGENVLTTKTQKNTNNPGWAASYEHIVTNRSKTKIQVVLKTADGKVLGKLRKSLNEYIDSTQVDQTWFPLSKGGEIRINASWKPVELQDAGGKGAYTPPIGVVRVSVQKAEDLRNLERVGKVDPYARLLVNGFQRARTAPVESSLNPTWNEVHYLTLASANQKLTIEAMDVEAHSADRTLGSFDVKLNEIINKNEKGQYIEHIDDEIRESKLIHKKGPKGTITYSLSFFPTLPVMTWEDIREEEEEKKLAEKKKKEEEKNRLEGKVDKEKTPTPPPGAESAEDDEDESAGAGKLKMSLDERTEWKSGVLVYEIIEGSFNKDNVYLQAFFDTHGHYDFVTQKLKEKNRTIGSTGDAAIKELEWSQACFKLTKDKDDNRAEKAIAETTIPTSDLLKSSFDEPTKIELPGAGSFTIRCDWIPIIFETDVPPQDKHNNCGILNVTVLRGENLVAADSNGKSDPFVRLYLNTEKEEFFKSKKVKKTLSPTWNESTSVEVFNKYDSSIRVHCIDWDIGVEQDDLLGVGSAKLSEVDPEGGETELEVPLTAEDGGDGGVVYLKCSFEPQFLLNVLPNSSSGIGDAFGTVGNVGLGVGKGVGKGLGKGVGKGVGGGVNTIGKGAKLFKKGLHLGKAE